MEQKKKMHTKNKTKFLWIKYEKGNFQAYVKELFHCLWTYAKVLSKFLKFKVIKIFWYPKFFFFNSF